MTAAAHVSILGGFVSAMMENGHFVLGLCLPSGFYIRQQPVWETGGSIKGEKEKAPGAPTRQGLSNHMQACK